MKKLGVLAVVALLAAPAMAEFQYTPQPFGDLTIGIINPANPGTLNTLYVTSGSGLMQSDTFQVTFGIHVQNAPIHAYGYQVSSFYLHFNFLYDNSSLEVLHAHHLPPWQFSNYASDTNWPNPSAGITGFSTLQNYSTTGSGYYYSPVQLPQSVVMPFFQATLHVKSAVQSQVNWFGITNMTVPSKWCIASSPIFDLTPAMFTYYNGNVHEAPEPATAIMGGFALLLGGLLRRR